MGGSRTTCCFSSLKVFFFHQCLPNTFRRNSWERTGVNKSEAKRLFRVLGSCFPGTCPQFLIGPLESPTVNSLKKWTGIRGALLSYISTVYWMKEWMNEWTFLQQLQLRLRRTAHLWTSTYIGWTIVHHIADALHTHYTFTSTQKLEMKCNLQ